MFFFLHSSTSEICGLERDHASIRPIRSLLPFLCLLAILGLAPLGVNAQVLYGTLTGNVTDSKDAAVPGAKVEATNLGTGSVKTVVTDERGGYSFTDLQPGTYKVLISGAGFKTAIDQSVAIAANTVTRFDTQLEVGDVNVNVDVSPSNDVILQTDRADINVVQTSREVNELPITGSAGRNYQSLLTIVPGAVKELGTSVVSNGAGEVNSASGSPQRSISFNVNGVSRLQNNTRVDGASVIYPWLPTNTAYVPIAESIQEVNIVTNSFDAEQGLVGGAFTNVVTKSGTNGFHGAGWGYLMNSTIGKARNYFQGTPQNPKDILAQYGYAVGGPIIKNRLFFFSDLERTTKNQTSTRVSPVNIAPLILRPTANGGVDFTATGTTIYDPLSNADPALRTPFAGNIIPANRISNAARALIGLLPQPTSAGLQANFLPNGDATFKRTNFDNKINWTATDDLSIWGRFSYSPTEIFESPILGEAGGDALNNGQLGTAPGRVYVFATGGAYTINSNMIVDWVYGYTLQNLGATFDLDNKYCLETLGIPGTNGPDELQGGKCAFQVSGWANMGNPNTGNPFKFHDKQFTFAPNFSWNKGSHGLRFGLDYQKQRINHFQPQGGTFQTVRGSFGFNGQTTSLQGGAAANQYNAWASFLLGLPNQAGKVDQLRNPNAVYFTSYGVYAKDHWQATRDLTVNIGLRWERYLRPDKDTTGINWFNPDDGNIYTGGLGNIPRDSFMTSGTGWILPRIGIAYRWNDQTVIRGGYGASIDPRPFIDFRNAYPIVNVWSMPTINNNPFIPVTTLTQGLINTSTPPDLTQGVLRLPANTGTTTYPRRPDRDMIHSFNLILERELPWKLKGTVGYVGTRVENQMGFININASAPGTGTNGRPLFQRFGLTQDINEIKPYGDVSYDSLQSTLVRRWANNGTFGVTYTWSKAINYADNDANPRIQWLPEKEHNKGRASYDRAHNLQIYGVMDLPFGKGRKWDGGNSFVNFLIGGWQINTIISAMSGTPFNVIQNTSNLNAGGSGQYPHVLRDIEILGGIGRGNPYFSNRVNGIAGTRNCTADCDWASENRPVLGSAPRNFLVGPGYFNVDAGAFKKIPIMERVELQLRIEALNLFNHANFGNPQGDINNADFGFITNTIGIGERNLRFAARVSF